jgi:hypothetical protein
MGPISNRGVPDVKKRFIIAVNIIRNIIGLTVLRRTGMPIFEIRLNSHNRPPQKIKPTGESTRNTPVRRIRTDIILHLGSHL